ncbi:MAG: thioredoxin-dependent thiol peroxidase [Candidatus Acidiferrum sp.]
MAKTALKVGDQAPDFQLLDPSGKVVALKDFKGQKVVIYFYPKAGTPGCTIEAGEFRDLRAKFAEQDVAVLGVSADAPKLLAGFTAKQKLNFTLLSDPQHQMIEAYGAWRMKKFMGRSFMGIVRSSYLIGRDGKIAQVWDHVKAKGHAAEVCDALS